MSESDVAPFTWKSEARVWPDLPAQGSATFDGARRNDRFAVWSLVCSIAGFVTGLTAILGIVFGFVARARITRSEESSKGRTLAMSGIILGLVALVWATVAIVVAIREADGNDLALATSQLLPKSVYPAGWQGEGTELGNDGANYFAGTTPDMVTSLEGCLHMRPAPVDANPTEATDQPYEPNKGLNVSVNDTVDVFSSTAAAATDAIASGKPNSLTCLFQVWGSGDSPRPLGYSLSEVTSRVRRLPPLVSHDSDVEVRYTYPVRSTDVFYEDYVTVQRGRSEINLDILDDGAPAPSSLIAYFARAAAKQLGGR